MHRIESQITGHGETVGLFGRQIDQLRQLDLGNREQRLGAFELAYQIEQRFLVAQRIDRRAQSFGLHLARIRQRRFGGTDGIGDLMIQPLRAGGAPECATDILQQRLDHLAPLFMADQDAIGLLARGKIADAKIKDVPRHQQVGGEVVPIGGDRGRQGLRAGGVRHRRTRIVVVA